MINVLKVISVIYLSVLAIMNITACEHGKTDKHVEAGISAGEVAGQPVSGTSTPDAGGAPVAGEVAGSIIVGDMFIAGIDDSGMIAGEETGVIAGEQAGSTSGEMAGEPVAGQIGGSMGGSN